MVLNIREFTQRINTREKQVRKVQTSSISPNDVIEMKQFLEAFDGDFEKKLDSKKAEKKVQKSEQTPPPPGSAAGA